MPAQICWNMYWPFTLRCRSQSHVRLVSVDNARCVHIRLSQWFLLKTCPTQSRDVILHTMRLLTLMLPYSLNSCLAFLPCSGPRINLFLSHKQAFKPINRKLMHVCMRREKLVVLYYNFGNLIVISFVYGHRKVGVNLLYVCVWMGVGSLSINSWFLKRPLIL